MKNYKRRCISHYHGQGIAARIAYYQKLGVMKGIMDIILEHMRDNGMNLENWNQDYQLPNNEVISLRRITIVIPTSNDLHDLFLDSGYPQFLLRGELCWIDMLHIDDSELQVHFMCYNRETEQFENRYWHTVRETLSLEDTCLLFEYVQDRLDDLIILPLEERDKYNSTGALGVK